MLKLSLTPTNVWFHGDDPVFDDVLGGRPKEERGSLQFLIRPMTTDIQRKINLEHTKTIYKTKFDSGRRVTVPEEEVNTTGIISDMVNHAVADWKGLGDVDGTPLPCTDGNKQLLASLYPGLSIAWLACSNMAQIRAVEERQDAEKN